jgi:hypothetical protein
LIKPPDEPRRRAFQHFDALDVGEVAEVQRVVAQAVDELVRDGGEAAQGHLVALAVTVRQADARHRFQCAFHRQGSLVQQQLLWHHVHGLRDVAQRRVDLGCAGRVRLVVVGRSGPRAADLDHGDVGLRLVWGRLRVRHLLDGECDDECQLGFLQCHFYPRYLIFLLRTEGLLPLNKRK